ncbi:MAG: hypothetical protein KC438_12460, partial [Thermomicrobiales bacterium]|nr:hypothetical protein [Thermomicrobiales bacterium]
MRRWLMVLMLATLSIGGMAEARAQEGAFPATPLRQLGLPELPIVTADSAMSVPPELDAGRYFLTVENVSAAGSIAIEFYRAPDGMAAVDMVPAFMDAAAANQTPAGFYDALITGGVVANAGSHGEAVIDLPAGSWLVVGYAFGEGQDGVVWQTTEVTGDIGDPEDPDSDVDVNLEDFAFDFS